MQNEAVRTFSNTFQLYIFSSLSALVFDIFPSITEQACRMCGKRANTIEHQPNYVAVNYSSVIQVCELADTYSFLFNQRVLKACSQRPQKKLWA